MKSPVIKHTVYGRLGRKISISLEDAFWSCLKEIAHAQGTTPSAMVAEIDKTRQHGNLSSAVRLFVLNWVRNGTGLTIRTGAANPTARMLSAI